MPLFHSVRDFSLKKAGVLALAMAGALALQSGSLSAGALSAEEIGAKYVDRAYSMQHEALPIMITLMSEGEVRVDGPIGNFRGEWVMAENTICLYFENGPKAGLTCGSLVATQDGGLRTDSGQVLRPLASALEID